MLLNVVLCFYYMELSSINRLFDIWLFDIGTLESYNKRYGIGIFQPSGVVYSDINILLSKS